MPIHSTTWIEVGQWIRRRKDAGCSLLASVAVQRWLGRFGRMLHLKIDSHKKALHLEMLLKGEHEPIRVTVHQYELFTDATGTSVIVHQFETSREWLTVALGGFLRGQRIAVPEQFASLLRLIA